MPSPILGLSNGLTGVTSLHKMLNLFYQPFVCFCHLPAAPSVDWPSWLAETVTGETAWEQWGTHRVTDWTTPSPSWFDRMNGYILAEAFPGFWKLWQNHEQLVCMAVDLYLHANLGIHGAGYEGGLILTQAALERFSYCVESGKAGVTD